MDAITMLYERPLKRKILQLMEHIAYESAEPGSTHRRTVDRDEANLLRELREGLRNDYLVACDVKKRMEAGVGDESLSLIGYSLTAIGTRTLEALRKEVLGFAEESGPIAKTSTRCLAEKLAEKLVEKLAEYADAPLVALAGSHFLVLRGAAREEAVARAVLVGGLDQIGGLHEAIRYAASLFMEGRVREVSADDFAAAKRWYERLGHHSAPLVARDWRGRITRVSYGDEP